MAPLFNGLSHQMIAIANSTPTTAENPITFIEVIPMVRKLATFLFAYYSKIFRCARWNCEAREHNAKISVGQRILAGLFD